MLRYQLEILSVCPTLASPNEHSLSYCCFFFFFQYFTLMGRKHSEKMACWYNTILTVVGSSRQHCN